LIFRVNVNNAVTANLMKIHSHPIKSGVQALPLLLISIC